MPNRCRFQLFEVRVSATILVNESLKPKHERRGLQLGVRRFVEVLIGLSGFG